MESYEIIKCWKCENNFSKMPCGLCNSRGALYLVTMSTDKIKVLTKDEYEDRKSALKRIENSH